MNANQKAFLAALRHSEGTDRAADPYRVCYGYTHTIIDLRDHPFVTGEWKGEKITVGRFAGEWSTAAGAYQMTHGTWAALKFALKLPDFSAVSQDAACLSKIQSRGGLDAINSGEIERACTLLCGTWASLPGSTAGQPTKRLDEIYDAFAAAGGSVA